MWAVWGHEPSWDQCYVDHILDMTTWDVMVSAEGPFAQDVRDAEKAYRQRGYPTPGTDDTPPLGVALGAGLYLGSTPHSLHDGGEYFSVTGAHHLTAHGAILISAMEAVYGPATYLTFLDT